MPLVVNNLLNINVYLYEKRMQKGVNGKSFGKSFIDAKAVLYNSVFHFKCVLPFSSTFD